MARLVGIDVGVPSTAIVAFTSVDLAALVKVFASREFKDAAADALKRDVEAEAFKTIETAIADAAKVMGVG